MLSDFQRNRVLQLTARSVIIVNMHSNQQHSNVIIHVICTHLEALSRSIRARTCTRTFTSTELLIILHPLQVNCGGNKETSALRSNT